MLEEVLATSCTPIYDEEWGQLELWTVPDLFPIIYEEFGGELMMI